jgi:hypothetical protein
MRRREMIRVCGPSVAIAEVFYGEAGVARRPFRVIEMALGRFWVILTLGEAI